MQDEQALVPEKVKDKRYLLLKMYNLEQILEELNVYLPKNQSNTDPKFVTVNTNLKFLVQLIDIFMMEIYAEQGCV